MPLRIAIYPPVKGFRFKDKEISLDSCGGADGGLAYSVDGGPDGLGDGGGGRPGGDPWGVTVHRRGRFLGAT